MWSVGILGTDTLSRPKITEQIPEILKNSLKSRSTRTIMK